VSSRANASDVPHRTTPSTGSPHCFHESKQRAVSVRCDSEVHPHAGPVVSRGYRHRLHLVAEALVAVGRGVNYTRAAQRARAAAGRDPLTGESAGRMVAEWVDASATAVLEPLAETEQPETLVLDSTDFWWTNSSTRTRRREFAILVAYGYTGPGKGRVWGIHACPTARASDYARLLRDLHLPGPLVSIVADDNLAVSAAVARVWPAAPGPSFPQPFLFACEHHLRLRALARSMSTAVTHHAGDGFVDSTPRSAELKAGTSSTTPPCRWAHSAERGLRSAGRVAPVSVEAPRGRRAEMSFGAATARRVAARASGQSALFRRLLQTQQVALG
jgi:hypothetical protein